MKLSARDIVLKLLGLLLLTAAVFKGYELLTEPVANADIWSNRYFLIFTVEFELALGIWLLSGLFKKLAWLAATACFTLFCCVTLYKALSGYGSCGCFGKVHVNPWITLFVIDMPAIVLLLVFKSKDLSLQSITSSISLLKPLPNLPYLAGVCIIGIAAIAITTPIIAFNEPATVTSTYEILEPEGWVGEELPILEYIDIGKQLTKGNWLVVLYHHNCPDCQKLISEYSQYYKSMVAKDDSFQISLIEMSQYNKNKLPKNAQFVTGHLANVKEWIVTTPVTIVLSQGKVLFSSNETNPEFEKIVTLFENI